MPFKAGVWPIPKGRVKLPEPATSDYIIPVAVEDSDLSTVTLVDDDFENSSTWEFVDISGNSRAHGIWDGHTYPWYNYYDSRATITPVSGNYVFRVDTTVNGSVQYALEKEMDVTNLTRLSGWVTNLEGSAYTYAKIQVLDSDDNIVAESEQVHLLSGSWQEVSIDLTSLTGTYKVRFYVWGTVQSETFVFDYITVDYISKVYTIDGKTDKFWSPVTSDPGKWIYIDAGAPKIISGVRVYWGSNVPNAFTVEVSTDATNWTPVYKQTTPPTPNAWQEIGFYATYARYIRIYLDDQGSNPAEIGEIQYYSSLVERVASEHGHGSGPEPWMQGANVRLRYVSKFANIQSRISSLQRDLQKSRTVNVKHVQELTGIVQDLKELVKRLHMS